MPRLSLESLETRETPAVIQPQMILTNPEATEGHVRHRMFAIVDRTQIATPAEGYSGTHVLYQDITIPAASAGDSYYGTGVYKSVDSGRTW
jgi:hypothetical protein